ncbi:MAG: NAD-dependent epimerase/dehydratase family protein [Armatimonadota bacterium]
MKFIKQDIIAPTLEQADFTDPGSLRKVIQAGDVVINAAGYANATDTTERGKALFRSINIDGVRNLADVCREKQVAQLIHISSVAAMGRLVGEQITEDMMRSVDSPYAESKLEGEKILSGYMSDLPITILRPTSVFGEGRGLANTLCRIISKKTVPLPMGGSAKIPFTYIGNIARCVELCIGRESVFGQIYIIGDSESYTLRNIVSSIAKAAGIDIKILPVPYAVAYLAAKVAETTASMQHKTPMLDMGRLHTLTTSVSYSIDKFRKATGYTPPFNLEASAAKIAQAYLKSNEMQK